MANNVSADFKSVWSRKYQKTFYKENVARQICDTSAEADLSSGQTLVRNYAVQPGYARTYVRGTDMVERTLTDTSETLTVNKQYYDFFYVDNLDKLQSDLNIALQHGENGAQMLSNQIDSDVLGEALNAYSTVDAGNVGGTAGQGITLSTTNVPQVITAVTQKLRKLNVMGSNKYAVVSPEFENIMVQYGVARLTVMGDALNRNPDFVNWMWYDFYVSNQLTGTAVLSMATNPTANDTVTIAGVTFTFVSSIGTTAGNVLIGASADATRANLETLINAPTATTATGVALSTDNGLLFTNRITAVNNNTADTITVTGKGLGVLVVAETLTAGADVWTTALQKQNCLFGIKGNPYLVVQKTPSIEFVKAPNRSGYFYQNVALYATKTFSDNAKQMVNVAIASSTFSA